MSVSKRSFKSYKIKKDYQTKNLKNPFFRRDNKNKKKRTLNISWYILGIFLIIIFILYGLFASSLFVIKNIKITGLGRLPESAITQRLWDQTNKKSVWPLNQKNIFLFNKTEAEADLMVNFNFSKIQISKNLFNSLSINIEERPYAFIWQEKGQGYYSDSHGFIIKDSQVSADDLKKFPVIENQTAETLIENDYLKIDPEYLSFIFAIKNESEKNLETAVNRYLIGQETNTIKVVFQNGLLAYFNVKDDVAKQVEKFLVVKREKIKDNIGSVNYIDLRYGDKVYIGNK
jgi:cell division septal protein FtsQ